MLFALHFFISLSGYYDLYISRVIISKKNLFFLLVIFQECLRTLQVHESRPGDTNTFLDSRKTHFILFHFLVLFCALSIIVSRDRNDGSFGIGFQNLIHNIIVQFISKEIYIAIIFCGFCCWLLNLSFSCLFTRFAGFIFFWFSDV